MFECEPSTREYVVPELHRMITEFVVREAGGLQGENASLNIIRTTDDFARFCLCIRSRFVGKQEEDPLGIVVFYVGA